MNKLLPAVFAAILLSGPSCSKPTSSTGGTASRQPGADEAKVFVQSLLPPALRFAEFKSDAPVHAPNSPPDGNSWIISVKLTLTPTEDLLARASADQDRAFYAPTQDLDDLKAWRNVYVRSIYALAYGAFDLTGLATPARLLVVQQAKDKPLVPLYGKITAEWLVDHWKFADEDLELPLLGSPRSAFADGPTLVLGSPEANRIAAAQRQGIDELRRKQAAVEDRFAKDLTVATKPGTVYRGQIKHPNGALPCEVRFVEVVRPEPQTVAFEVRLPQDPAYLFVYIAKSASKVPLDIPMYGAADKPAVPATSEADADRPLGNLTVHYVRGTGKTSTYGNWPGVLLNGASRISSNDQPFVLLGGRLKGLVGDFNGEYFLDAEQVH